METYPPVVDSITFMYLISLAINEKLGVHLSDVVIAYLYGSLDSEIYMKILERFKMSEAYLENLFNKTSKILIRIKTMRVYVVQLP